MTKARVNADNASADIQGVTAGTGLTGGGTSGTVTLDVDTAVIQARVANVTDTEIGYLDGVTSAVQTQLDAKIAKSLTTTTGDIIYASSANTPARLGIGSSAQVLTVSGGVPSWATPATPATNKSFSLLSSASASGQTYTVSGLSGYDIIMLSVYPLSANGDFQARIRLNSDSTTKYSQTGLALYSTSYSADRAGIIDDTSFTLMTGGQAAFNFEGGIMIYGANSTGPKLVQTWAACGSGGTTSFITQGWYTGTSVISSISLFNSIGSNTWDNGTVRIWGAA
jgi:hypothetical protein